VPSSFPGLIGLTVAVMGAGLLLRRAPGCRCRWPSGRRGPPARRSP
jgi:hypothetical protein